MTWFVSVSLALLFFSHTVVHAQNTQLLAAAKKERTLNFYRPSTLTQSGVQLLAEAFNRKHDLDGGEHLCFQL